MWQGMLTFLFLINMFLLNSRVPALICLRYEAALRKGVSALLTLGAAGDKQEQPGSSPCFLRMALSTNEVNPRPGLKWAALDLTLQISGNHL